MIRPLSTLALLVLVPPILAGVAGHVERALHVHATTASQSSSAMLKIMRSRRMPALLTTMFELAEGIERALDDPLGGLEVADALAVGHRLAAHLLDLADHLLRWGCIGGTGSAKWAPRSVDDHLRAMPSPSVTLLPGRSRGRHPSRSRLCLPVNVP